MRNVDVLFAFVTGLNKQRTKNLFIDNDRLYHHNTCLAERKRKRDGSYSYVVNVSKYSQSTTTIQNALLRTIPNPEKTLRCVTEVQKGADSLS
ncbi:hypothetical protein [Bacillus phage vB_BanS-Thrax1]|nr:hypothetical protein [Bacillus phage vB_BanS-Thrax1]